MPSRRRPGPITPGKGSCEGRSTGTTHRGERPRVRVPAFAGTTSTRWARFAHPCKAFRLLQREAEFGFGLGLDFVEGDAIGKLDQGHAVIAVLVDGEDRKISD